MLDYAHVLISILDYSYDGINWTTKDNSVTSANWYSVCYGNGKFVAVAYNNSKIAYSYDGINWTTKDNSVTSAYWYSVCYGNGKFVAVSSSDKIAYSFDSFIKTDYPIIAPNIPANLESRLEILDNNAHDWASIYPIGSIYITTESDIAASLNSRFGFGTWEKIGNTTINSNNIYYYKRTA